MAAVHLCVTLSCTCINNKMSVNQILFITYDRVLVAMNMIVVMWQPTEQTNMTSLLMYKYRDVEVPGALGEMFPFMVLLKNSFCECEQQVPFATSLGYIEQPDIMSIFLCTSVIDSNTTTRMQSSRMRTIRCSGHVLGGVSAQEGCLPRGSLPAGGGVFPGGCLTGGLYLGRVSARGGVCPVNRITDRCKKHYLATTMLQMVIITWFQCVVWSRSEVNPCLSDNDLEIRRPRCRPVRSAWMINLTLTLTTTTMTTSVRQVKT